MQTDHTPESDPADIPDELKELLIQFSVAYLVDRPTHIVDFAADYFQNLQNERNAEQENEKNKITSRIAIHDKNPNSDHNIARCRTERLDTGVVGTVEEELIRGIDLPLLHPKTADEKYLIYTTIKDYAIFRTISKSSLYQIIDYMPLRTFEANETVYEKDELGESFYIIKSGTFEQFRHGHSLRMFQNSGGFGELALLYSAPRGTSV